MRTLRMTAWIAMVLLAALPLLAQKQQMTPLDQARRAQSASSEKQAAAAPARQRSTAGSQAAPAPAAPATPAAAAAEKGGKPGDRRDPFVSVIKPPQPGQSGEPTNCGPGTRGIIVGQTELNGVVRSPSGVLAVVTTRNNSRTYFLKEGTMLCNGRVTSITSDSMTIEEDAIDPMGKPAKREVIRKIPAEAK